MDSFLSELNTAGEHESQGVFTINAEKAQIKLAQYQLGKLEDLSKILIFMATTFGCKVLTVETRSSKTPFSKAQHTTRITFTPLMLSYQDISTVGFQSLQREAPPRLRFLAIVLSTLCAHQRVLLMSGGESCDISLHIGPEGIRDAPPEEDCFRPHSAVLVVKEQILERLESGLRTRSRWCPCAIRLLPTGKPAVQGLSTTRVLSSALGIIMVNADSLKIKVSRLVEHSIQSTKDNSALPLVLALTRPHEAIEVGLSIVVHGVAFPIHLELKIPELCGAIVADHLSLDLSYQTLVKNAEYLEVLEELKKSIPALMRVVLSKERRLDDKQEERLYEIITQLSDQDAEAELLSLLQRSSSKMRPAADPASFNRLQARLSRSSPEAGRELFAAYRTKTREFWQSGRLSETLRYLMAEVALRQSVQFESARQKDMVSLCRVFLGTIAESFPTLPLLEEYLARLNRWAHRQAPPPSEFHPDIHPTWYLPFLLDIGEKEGDPSELFALFDKGVPSWLTLWALLREKEAERAIKLVRETPDFNYPANRLHWDEFFWFHCRGMLPWASAVRLRVALSGAQFDPSVPGVRSFSESLLQAIVPAPSLGAEISQQVLLSFPHASFWPSFFSLQYLGASSLKAEQYRTIWLKMVAKTLLGHLLEYPEADPLSFPFVR